MIDELMAWLKRAGRDYPRLKASAERRVARWEWATDELRNLEPLYFERHTFPRGRRLAAPPAVIQEGFVAYGMDAEERVVVERKYCGIVHAGERWFYEIFYEYPPGKIERVYFDYYSDKAALAVARAMLSAGRITTLATCGVKGGRFDRYQYDGDRIVRIDREGLGAGDSGPGWSDWFNVEWADRGELLRILKWDPYSARVHTVFEKRAKGETFKAVLGAIEEMLVAEIPKAVASLRLEEPAYSVVLAFDGEGNDMLPPVIGVGLASEWQTWVAGGAEEASGLLWNPAEYRHYGQGPLSLSNKQLLAACAKANQEIAMKDKWSAGRTALERVADSLRTLSWEAVLPTTDDFVVYPVDFELGGLHRSLRAAAGKARFDRWKRAGLVP